MMVTGTEIKAVACRANSPLVDRKTPPNPAVYAPNPLSLTIFKGILWYINALLINLLCHGSLDIELEQFKATEIGHELCNSILLLFLVLEL